MIVRLWHGWTTPQNADRYEALLRTTVFPSIIARDVAGFHDIVLLRRDLGEEVEFATVMRFDSLDAIRQFAGADYDVAVVPDAARALLSHFDARAAHYEVRESRSSPDAGADAP